MKSGLVFQKNDHVEKNWKSKFLRKKCWSNGKTVYFTNELDHKFELR